MSSFHPDPAPPMTGAERFVGIDESVAEFWRFAMGDLRTNNVRGYLAEYLVARAVGSTGSRVEWDPWDVTAPDGTRVEVKASGFLQSWSQRALSIPRFQVRPSGLWDEASGTRSGDRSFHAHVYVFCLQTARTHDEYQPLDVSQWVFYTAPRQAIEQRAGASMGLSTLTLVCGDPVDYSSLRSAVAMARQRSDQVD